MCSMQHWTGAYLSVSHHFCNSFIPFYNTTFVKIESHAGLCLRAERNKFQRFLQSIMFTSIKEGTRQVSLLSVNYCVIYNC
jgi:hypothetical protein